MRRDPAVFIVFAAVTSGAVEICWFDGSSVDAIKTAIFAAVIAWIVTLVAEKR